MESNIIREKYTDFYNLDYSIVIDPKNGLSLLTVKNTRGIIVYLKRYNTRNGAKVAACRLAEGTLRKV